MLTDFWYLIMDSGRQTGAVPAAGSVQSYANLAADVLARAPRLGAVRLVAVDGYAGSGKTTFAERLGTALDAQVLHTDDLLEGWTDTVGFWDRLERWVLAPLRAGQRGAYRRYDWDRREFAEWHAVPPAPALVVEGVTSARAVVRAELALSIWVEAQSTVCLARGLARDGEALRPQWEQWRRDEAAHFALDRTRDHVDLIVDGDPTVPHDPERHFVSLRSQGSIGRN